MSSAAATLGQRLLDEVREESLDEVGPTQEYTRVKLILTSC